MVDRICARHLPFRMVRIPILLIVMIFGPPFAAPAQNGASDPSLQDTLVAEVNTFMHAWKKQDAAALAATLAPEFLYVSSQGVSSKERVVETLMHVCTLTSYSLSDMRMIPISENSAALVYKIHQASSCEGHADPTLVLNTDTLVRREGKWMFLLTTSATPAVQEERP
jgi:hypothetical protein